MNKLLFFELDLFNESVDPVHRISLNDLLINQTDLILKFTWVHSMIQLQLTGLSSNNSSSHKAIKYLQKTVHEL